MKKTIVYLAMAVLALASCQKKNNERPNSTNPGGDDKPPVVIEEQKVEGSGNLIYIDVDTHAEIATNSTYKWSATEENGIQIEINVDTKQYIEGDGTETGVPGGAWEIGVIKLPLADINEFLGVSVSETLNFDNFKPVCDYLEGASGWTSYKPGMWFNNDNLGCGWGDGTCFWQWYIWGGKTFGEGDSAETVGYDLSDDGNYDNYKGILFVGGNPGNTKKSGGVTIKSHNVMKIGKEVNFDITIKFGPYDAPVDTSVGHTEAEGESALLNEQGEDIEGTKLAWNCTEAGLYFNAELSISGLGSFSPVEGTDPLEYSGGPWAIGYVKFDLDWLSGLVGKDFTTLTKDDLYPVDKDGNRLTKMYTGADLTESDTEGWTTWGTRPGEWITPDGRLSNWSAGAAYWWINLPDNYDSFDVPGSFVIGNGPSTNHTVGQEVISYNICCGKPFNVTIKYVE